MEKGRDATDTIIGYYYQFDYTILQLLELQNEDDAVTIEGIEDVDILTTDSMEAVQCKYSHTSHTEKRWIARNQAASGI